MNLLKCFYFAGIFFYIYLPISVLIVNAFNLNKYGIKWDGFTVKWFTAMLENHSLMEAACHSLVIAVSAATVSTMIGALTAIGLKRYRFFGRKVIQGTNMALMMAPDIILAIAFLVLFVTLGMGLGFWSLLFSHITFCLPFTIMTITGRLQDFDPNIIDAARDLGASEKIILTRIIVPMMRPALISSWLLAFVLSLDDVIISSFVTGPSYDVLPLKIFSMVKVGVNPEVNALAALLVVLCLALVMVSQLMSGARKK